MHLKAKSSGCHEVSISTLETYRGPKVRYEAGQKPSRSCLIWCGHSPAGAPARFGRIAVRAVSERITYGTSDVGRPGSPGCLRIRSCAGDDGAGRTIGACPDSTGAKRSSASAQGQGSSGGTAATKGGSG